MILLITLLCALCCSAQESDVSSIPIGIYLQGGITSPLTQNVYCLDPAACPPFSRGHGLSMDAMVTTSFPLNTNASVITGIGGGLWTTTMSSTDAAGRTRDAQGNVVDFVREQTLNARAEYLAAMAGFSYSIDALHVSIGPRLEVTLRAPVWEQRSRIIAPSNVTYPDGSLSFTPVAEQAIPSANLFRVSAVAIVEYAIPVTPSMQIASYGTLSYSPTAVRRGTDWTDLRAAIGMALHTSIALHHQSHQPDTSADRTPEIAHTVTPPAIPVRNAPEEPVAPIPSTRRRPNIVLLRRDGTHIGNNRGNNPVTVHFTTQEQSTTHSILPFVFFDSASAELPARYRQPPTNIYQPTSANDQHGLYLDLLNVVGKRMQESSDTILLVGYSDPASEGGSCILAQQRTATLRRYFLDHWHLDSARVRSITGPTNCIPRTSSPTASEMGRAENRRVEIRVSNYGLYSPIVRRTATTVINSDLDDIKIDSDSGTGTDIDSVIQWNTALMQNGATVQRSSLDPSRPLLLNITGVTMSGDTVEATIPIATTVKKQSVGLHYVSLATFEFGSATVTPRDSALLHDFAVHLSKDDTIAVYGYSDEQGSPAYNVALSLERAKVVANLLRTERSDCVISNVIGYGARRYPRGVDSYAFPELRFMCRTVQVEVESGE